MHTIIGAAELVFGKQEFKNFKSAMLASYDDKADQWVPSFLFFGIIQESILNLHPNLTDCLFGNYFNLLSIAQIG
jgi:hypothetical protein